MKNYSLAFIPLLVARFDRASAQSDGIASTELPSLTSSSLNQCMDSDTFRWNDIDTKGCEWLAENELRRERLCEKGPFQNGCPQTCRKACCENDKDFSFVTRTGSTKNCFWLGKQRDSKLDLYCNDIVDKVLIKNKCPIACGACANVGSSGPSISPMDSGGNEVDEDVSSAADNGKCLDDGDFFVNSDPTKTCSWISKRSRRSGRFCEKTNVANKCRQTCRTCCTDVEDYTPTMSGSGKEKGCAWLGAQNRCDKRYGGFLVRNKCPVSCGLCDPSAALTIDTEGLHSSENLTNTTQAPTMSPSGGMNSTTLAN